MAANNRGRSVVILLSPHLLLATSLMGLLTCGSNRPLNPGGEGSTDSGSRDTVSGSSDGGVSPDDSATRGDGGGSGADDGSTTSDEPCPDATRRRRLVAAGTHEPIEATASLPGRYQDGLPQADRVLVETGRLENVYVSWLDG